MKIVFTVLLHAFLIMVTRKDAVTLYLRGIHNIHNSLSNFPRKPYHILDKQYSLLTNNLSVGWLKRTPREIENIFNDFVDLNSEQLGGERTC